MKRFSRRIAGVLIAPAVMAALVVGCGGGESSSSDTGAGKTTASGGSTSNTEPSAEPSAEFAGKSESGKLATLGKEADPAEREAASAVIEESLKAREAGDWSTQCSLLAAVVIKQIEKSTVLLGGNGKGCVKALEAQAQPVPASVRANTMSGPIDALRVNGDQGYAFYHGTKGKDYMMLLLKEGSEWKLGALKEKEAP